MYIKVLNQSQWRKKGVRMLTINQLTDPYLLPFCLDNLCFQKGQFVLALFIGSWARWSLWHTLSWKDIKFDLKSRKDASACTAVGIVLAQRAIEDDIHNVVCTPRKGEWIEGKIQIVFNWSLIMVLVWRWSWSKAAYQGRWALARRAGFVSCLFCAIYLHGTLIVCFSILFHDHIQTAQVRDVWLS